MVQEAVRKWWLPCAVVLALVSLDACQKIVQKAPTPDTSTPSAAATQPQTVARAQSAAAAAAPGPPQPSAPIVLTKEHSAAATPTTPRALANPAGLMALDREKRFLPEDFKIGPLGDAHGNDARANAATATAEDFLGRLVAGSIETRDITPEAQASLSDTLMYGLKRGTTPTAYRIGTASADASGQWAAPVRLWGAVGTSEGEIYFVQAGDEWLVQDLQVSLAQLAVARTAPKGKFFPSAYRWLLGE
jgi:hypothetical protein